jgi:hypothetical protein
LSWSKFSYADTSWPNFFIAKYFILSSYADASRYWSLCLIQRRDLNVFTYLNVRRSKNLCPMLTYLQILSKSLISTLFTGQQLKIPDRHLLTYKSPQNSLNFSLLQQPAFQNPTFHNLQHSHNSRILKTFQISTYSSKCHHVYSTQNNHIFQLTNKPHTIIPQKQPGSLLTSLIYRPP